MKVITPSNAIIKLVPREYPILTDTVTAAFINEETLSGEPINFTWSIDHNLLVLTIQNPEILTLTANYEFSVFLNGSLIFKDKVVLLGNNTDVQNYEPQNQNTARWQE